MIGETLGQRYRLLRLLGRGGMGSVYEAERTDTLEHVAVKVLHSHLQVPGAAEPRRFRREATAVQVLRSEHIVRVLDVGADEATGHQYLVTERLDGDDLQTLLDRIGPLSLGGALAIAAQALRGLAEAHAAGIVHRDIKPANLFLARRPDGAMTVKLLDFGIAKVEKGLLGAALTTDLTTTGSFLGSPLYMSPEQVQNSRDVDHRTDLWSLGCVLYAALAGRAPHQHLTALGQLLVAICVSPPPPLADVAPWVPREVADLVHAALEIQPAARYPSAAAMLEALRRFAPAEVIVEELLASSGSPRVATVSSLPPSPARSTPRVVVAPALDRPIRGDEVTEHASSGVRVDPLGATLGSAPDRTPSREVARSGVPVGLKAAGRHITVDPRRILGEKSELWTFSLEVHRHLPSLLSRIWKALRRAGASLPPMTYGTAWVLFEPRTGRTIVDPSRDPEDRPSLEDAGIRPGTVLWILRPGAPDVPGTIPPPA